MPSPAEYTLELRARRLKVLIAGGGKVALQKLKGLPKTWSVTVVAPEFVTGLRAGAGRRLVRRRARLSDVDKAQMVFAATDDGDVNAALAARALKRGKLVSVADDPKLGNFIVPAVARAGKIRATLSTGGASPALSKALRQWLEKRLNKPRLQAWVASRGRQRARFKADPGAKARSLKELSDPKWIERMLQ